MTELSFNTTFWLEIGAFAALLKLKDAGLLDRERFGRVLFHLIEASPELEKIAASTKRNNSEPFLRYLFGLGRKTAEEWFARHGEAIGARTTFDFKKLLPDEHLGDVSTFPLSDTSHSGSFTVSEDFGVDGRNLQVQAVSTGRRDRPMPCGSSWRAMRRSWTSNNEASMT